MGDTGEDVKNLQKVLNSDPRTVVSLSGIGSNGQESAYFGQKTKSAVMKFQAIYLPEALGVGAGTIAPTGFVGVLTRGKLNSLSQVQNVSPSQMVANTSQDIPTNIPVPSQTDTVFSVPQTAPKTPEQLTAISFFNSSVYKVKPQLINLSRYEAKQGMEVTINGSGFLPKGNTVHFGSRYIADGFPNTDGTTLTFIVPGSVNNGKYNVYVSNANGDTQNILVGDYFTVTDSPRDSPVVEQVSLSTSDSKMVIIQGKNFDISKNTIYSNLGTVEQLSSQDGKTIAISLTSFSNYKTIKPVVGTPFQVPMYVYVKNDAGISTTPTLVMLTF